MKASECKCCVCGKQAVAFWPLIDPDIPELPYCRKCLDEAKIKLITALYESKTIHVNNQKNEEEMNKQRKEALQNVAGVLEEANALLGDVIADEQEAYDNMPIGFQDGPRGQGMLEAIDQMENWSSEIEAIQTKIEKYSANRK